MIEAACTIKLTREALATVRSPEQWDALLGMAQRHNAQHVHVFDQAIGGLPDGYLAFDLYYGAEGDHDDMLAGGIAPDGQVST